MPHCALEPQHPRPSLVPCPCPSWATLLTIVRATRLREQSAEPQVSRRPASGNSSRRGALHSKPCDKLLGADPEGRRGNRVTPLKGTSGGRQSLPLAPGPGNPRQSPKLCVTQRRSKWVDGSGSRTAHPDATTKSPTSRELLPLHPLLTPWSRPTVQGLGEKCLKSPRVAQGHVETPRTPWEARKVLRISAGGDRTEARVHGW